MSARATRVTRSSDTGHTTRETGSLTLAPSPLRPQCRADERIFQWRGVNTAPPNVLDHPVLVHLAGVASRHSLRETTSYGSGLRKFHLFCDVFSVPESARLPASFVVLHSFVLWASADPDPEDPSFADGTPFETVAPQVALKYLSAVRAWHIAQGWPPPLTEDDHQRIQWSVRGLANMQQGRRSKPPRPPITLHMLAALKATLRLTEPFDACVWAMATCAFWGMMRFGEVSVKSRSAFNRARHLKRADAHFDNDLAGCPYVRLDLPSAKTAAPGEVQQVFIQSQSSLCALEALQNLARVVPAAPDDPLFSWRDTRGDVRPMIRHQALDRVNAVLRAWHWGTTFGHSFRIGGASFYLGQKVDPEIVRVAGRWRSLAYEAYIRAFEQVSSVHTGGLAARNGF